MIDFVPINASRYEPRQRWRYFKALNFAPEIKVAYVEAFRMLLLAALGEKE